MSKLKVIFTRIFFPIIVFLLFFFLYLHLPEIIKTLEMRLLSTTIVYLNYSIGIVIWLSLAWVLIRFIDVVFWEFIVEERLNRAVPSLIKQLTHIIIFFIALLGIVGVVFDQSVTGLLTASGIIGLIIGFAIKNIIADVFNGLALSIDKPFQIGDFLLLHDPNINESGRILEITWRTTRLETLDRKIMVVPNQQLSSIPITNYTVKTQSSGVLPITLDVELDYERAINILTAATLSTKGILDDPNTRVSLNHVDEKGIRYHVNYWFDKNYTDPLSLKTELIRNIQHHLQNAGIRQGIPKNIINHQSEIAPDYTTLPTAEHYLRQVDLFNVLTESLWNILLDRIEIIQVKNEDIIVKEKEKGDSMYVLAEGLLKVYITADKDEHQEIIEVGKIIAGQFFGEMSLLTGEPRSATVKAATDSILIKITKSAMGQLFKKEPTLIEKISQIIAAHQETNIKAQQAWLDKKTQKEHQQKFTSVIIQKIKSFFGLKDKPGME